MAEPIKISSLKIKFKEILGLIDNAIEERKKIEIPNEILNRKTNIILLIKWLEKHKIIELKPIITRASPKLSIKSREMKIQIALQLKAMGFSVNEIAKIFSVKPTTAQGYLKELVNVDQKYLDMLRIILNLKGITIKSLLNEFPVFPIRFDIEKVKENFKPFEFEELIIYINRNKWIKIITGKNLGTQELSLLLPKK